MEINQNYRDVLDKVTEELLSLSKEEFFARLDQHKDGPISMAMKELEEFAQWRQDDFEEKLINKVRDFLGEDGIGFFNEMLEKHGEISPVFLDCGMPHAVHFREGMQVRNFLRGIEECEGWDDNDFDDYWGKLVEAAIEEII